VKLWSEIVIKGWRLIDSGHIKAMASILIAEERSLVECGSTAMPSHQRQIISDNSAIVSIDEQKYYNTSTTQVLKYRKYNTTTLTKVQHWYYNTDTTQVLKQVQHKYNTSK